VKVLLFFLAICTLKKHSITEISGELTLMAANIRMRKQSGGCPILKVCQLQSKEY